MRRDLPKTAKPPAVMAAGAAAGLSEFVPGHDEIATVAARHGDRNRNS